VTITSGKDFPEASAVVVSPAMRDWHEEEEVEEEEHELGV
jgi:hypothetical protein